MCPLMIFPAATVRVPSCLWICIVNLSSARITELCNTECSMIRDWGRTEETRDPEPPSEPLPSLISGHTSAASTFHPNTITLTFGSGHSNDSNRYDGIFYTEYFARLEQRSNFYWTSGTHLEQLYIYNLYNMHCGRIGNRNNIWKLMKG